MKELSYFEEQYNIAASARDSLMIKMAVTGCSALLFFLLTVFSLPTPVTSIFSLVFCIVIYLTCRVEINDGLLSLLRMNPSNDSFNAIALLVTVIHGTSLLFFQPENQNFFGAILFFSLFCSMAMKYCYVQEILNNLNLIRNRKTFLVNVSELILTKRYINRVCTVNPVVEFPNVVETTYESDPSEEKNKKFVPLTVAGTLVLSLICGIFNGFSMFLPSLAALVTICATFTGEMEFVLPYIVMQRKMRRLGSVLLGYRSIDNLKDIDTLMIRDRDLFPPKKNQLIEMKFQLPQYLAESVEYTAALLNISHSPLAEAFSGVLDCSVEKLPPVLQWRFIKNYGIVASVNVDSVLLGNRNLLQSHNILPYSTEQEAALTAGGNKLTYLTINGQIAAILIFRYEEDRDLKRAAEHAGGEFTILIDTNDCHVNETMIQQRYELSRTKIIVPDPDELTLMEKLRNRQNERPKPPVMISTQNALGILESVRWAKNLSHTVDWSIFTQKGSVLLGLVLTAAALCIAPGTVSWLWLFLYDLLWSIPIFAIAFHTK